VERLAEGERQLKMPQAGRRAGLGIVLAGGAILLAALAAYHGTLAGPFVLDDLSSIAGNPTIRRLWPLGLALTPPHGGGLTVEGRPLLNLSFAVNYAVSGTRVWSYHAANLAIHVLAGLTLFGIVRRTLARAGSAAGGAHATWLAAAAAVLWTVHPLQTESVTYLVQRAESLMGLFYLLTLYCFARGVEGRPRGWLALSLLCCLLGMATKEVMVSAPVIVFAYDVIFVAGGRREAWRRRRGYYLGLAATWLLLAWLVAGAGNRGGTSGWGSGLAAPAYWATQGPALARYLRLAAWPHPLVFDYGTAWGRAAADRGWGLLAVVLLAGGTIWALGRRPALGFLGFCFLILLAPTSLVPGNRQTVAEHRMYLALAPLVVLAVLAIYRAAGPRPVVPILCLVAGGLILLTVRRNRVYRSPLVLYADNVAHCPGNAFAECNLGAVLDSAGRAPEAIAHLEEALRLRPDYPVAQDNLGNALLHAGRVDEAIVHYRAALRLDPGLAEAEDNLGTAWLRHGDLSAAVASYEEALRLDPGRVEAHNNLANILAQQGRLPEAIGHYEAALALDPDYAEADNNLGNALARQGRLPEAILRYREALRLQPAYAEAHFNLGNALESSGGQPQALDEFAQALEARPDYLSARENLGNALVREGRPAEGAKEYEAVLRLAPARAVTHYNLGNALLRLGRRPEAVAQFQEALWLQPDFPAAREILGRLPR
jgi:tetratricopeptide (TPR) repeat protein